MHRLLTLLLIASTTLGLRAERAEPPDDTDRDRGSVTIEHVLWAVAVIAIVAIVVAAVRAYVTSQAGNIR